MLVLYLIKNATSSIYFPGTLNILAKGFSTHSESTSERKFRTSSITPGN